MSQEHVSLERLRTLDSLKAAESGLWELSIEAGALATCANLSESDRQDYARLQVVADLAAIGVASALSWLALIESDVRVELERRKAEQGREGLAA